MCVLHNIYNIIYNISFAARAFDSATAEAVSLSLYRYILLSYSVIARGRRLVAILTAVYMPMIILWRSTRAVRETMTVCRREKWLPQIKFRPNEPYLYIPITYEIYVYIYKYMIFRGNTHARTPVYFGEQWRRAVCVIRILIIKISHGFDRFSSLETVCGPRRKYFRYSLNVDDVSRALQITRKDPAFSGLVWFSKNKLIFPRTQRFYTSNECFVFFFFSNKIL